MTLYDDLIEIGNSKYIFDFEALTKAVRTPREESAKTIRIVEQKDRFGGLVGTEIETETSENIPEIDVAKFELVSNLINSVLMTDLEEENSLGSAHMLGKAPLAFKLAFNTLLSMGIIKEI